MASTRYSTPCRRRARARPSSATRATTRQARRTARAANRALPKLLPGADEPVALWATAGAAARRCVTSARRQSRPGNAKAGSRAGRPVTRWCPVRQPAAQEWCRRTIRTRRGTRARCGGVRPRDSGWPKNTGRLHSRVAAVVHGVGQVRDLREHLEVDAAAVGARPEAAAAEAAAAAARAARRRPRRRGRRPGARTITGPPPGPPGPWSPPFAWPMLFCQLESQVDVQEAVAARSCCG